MKIYNVVFKEYLKKNPDVDLNTDTIKITLADQNTAGTTPESFDDVFDADDLKFEASTIKPRMAVVYKDRGSTEDMPLWKRVLARIPFIRRFVVSYVIDVIDLREMVGYAVIHQDRGWTRVCKTKEKAENIKKAMAGKSEEYRVERVKIIV